MIADSKNENPKGQKQHGAAFLNRRAQALKRRDRRRKLASLYLSGLTNQEQLAEALSTSRSTIYQDLRWLRARWERESLATIKQHKERQYQELQRMKRAAWEAWHESKKDAEIITETIKADGTKVIKTVRKGQTGSASFLARLHDLLELEAKMFGTIEAETTIKLLGNADIYVMNRIAEMYEEVEKNQDPIVIDSEYIDAEVTRRAAAIGLPSPEQATNGEDHD